MQLEVTPDQRLIWPGGGCRCALGRGGRKAAKREGDGATPIGTFPLRRVHYRADRVAPPATRLPVRAIAPEDGWCDDTIDDQYNKLVRLPFAARHEVLWREDHLYDLIVEIGYNDAPPEPDKGSAIFLHVATPDFSPTEGCVAIPQEQLVQLVDLLVPDSRLLVRPPA